MERAGRDHVAEFTRQLLSTGLWLCDLASDLVESLPDDAYPGENPGAVVLEMVTGTIGTALADAAPERLLDAIDLICLARERVLEHLELALELSKRDENGPANRAYG